MQSTPLAAAWVCVRRESGDTQRSTHSSSQRRHRHQHLSEGRGARMNDRLGELMGGGGRQPAVAPFEIAIDINDGGAGGGGGGGASGAFMEGFFDKVNAVKKDIDAVKKVRLHALPYV